MNKRKSVGGKQDRPRSWCQENKFRQTDTDQSDSHLANDGEWWEEKEDGGEGGTKPEGKGREKVARQTQVDVKKQFAMCLIAESRGAGWEGKKRKGKEEFKCAKSFSVANNTRKVRCCLVT